jgi:hypothetical protein
VSFYRVCSDVQNRALINSVQMVLCAMLLCSIAHSIICTRLFRGKMHSDWFNGKEILQGRWQHGEKVGYCYPIGLENTFVSGTYTSMSRWLQKGLHGLKDS